MDMTRPPKKYARNVPYTSLSVTLPARDAVRKLAAVLSGKTGRRVGLSEAIIAVVRAADYNDVAKQLGK